ncbi:MAG: DegV family protein [Bacilli bacterium]
MKVKIITDSASDISQLEASELGINVMPIKIIFKEEEFYDGVTINNEEFYKRLIEGEDFPKTSQISPYEYEQEFKKYEGEELIVITLSKHLSGCYQSALLASKNFSNVHVIDSASVTIGQQILVKYALKLSTEGKRAKEIVDLVELAKKDLCLVAVLDTLEYLKKGGRISATTAFVGTILSIKPVVAVKDGKVKMLGKARGSKNGNNMLRKIVKEKGGINEDLPYKVAYAGLSDSSMKKYLKDSKDLYSAKVSDVPVGTIGATIGTHVGPGAVAVAFFKNNKHE